MESLLLVAEDNLIKNYSLISLELFHVKSILSEAYHPQTDG